MPPLLADWRHLPTHRRVWALATPMMLSNLSVPLVALVDSAVAGHLPAASDLGAVAIGGTVYALPAWSLGFLRMGTTGFSAQAHGAGDGTALRGVLVQALALALLLGLAAWLLLAPLAPQLVALMRPSPELAASSVEYLRWRLPGLPAALVNYALAGWFIGRHATRTTLLLVTVTNLANIALNLWFVLGLGHGVGGIALASALAEWGGALLGLALAGRALAGIGGGFAWRALGRWAQWRSLLAVNRDIFLRTLALQGVFFAVTLLGTRLGDAVVAANALLLNGLLLVAFGLDGLANAVEALSGHAIGAGDAVGLRRALVVASGWALLGSLGFALAFLAGGPGFIALQTDLPEVRATAARALPWLAVLPLVTVWSYLLDGLFVGATRAREMRDTMLVSALAFLALAFALRGAGNAGLWLALLGFMAVRGASLGWAAWRIQRRHAWLVRRTPVE